MNGEREKGRDGEQGRVNWGEGVKEGRMGDVQMLGYGEGGINMGYGTNIQARDEGGKVIV